MTQNIRVSEAEFRKECLLIVDIAMHIHRNLGYGFPEITYKNAFENELICMGINYQRNQKFAVNYNGLIQSINFMQILRLKKK